MTAKLVPVFLLSLFAAGCATSAATDSVRLANGANATRPAPVKKEVAEFVVDAVDARRMDYAEGKLAAERGTTSAIRDYGQLMLRDQTQLLAELNAVAAHEQITVPETLGAAKADHLRELMELNGEKFDKAFISSITIDHKRDVGEFKKASGFEQPVISAYAARRLPLIQAHLEKIEAIHDAR